MPRGPLSDLATVGSGTSLAIPWTGAQPAPGSKVVVWVQFHAAAATFLTLTDNGTSITTFTLGPGSTAQPGGIWIYYGDGISLPASGNYTVTVTSTASPGTIVGGGIAYTRIRAGAPTATNTGTSAGSTSVSSGSATPNAPGGLYFSAFSDNTGLNPETITPTWTAGTQQFVETNGSSFFACAASDSLTASGAQTGTWTLGDSTAWVAAIAAWDAIPAVPQLPPQPPPRPAAPAAAVPPAAVTSLGWSGPGGDRTATLWEQARTGNWQPVPGFRPVAPSDVTAAPPRPAPPGRGYAAPPPGPAADTVHDWALEEPPVLEEPGPGAADMLRDAAAGLYELGRIMSQPLDAPARKKRCGSQLRVGLTTLTCGLDTGHQRMHASGRVRW